MGPKRDRNSRESSKKESEREENEKKKEELKMRIAELEEAKKAEARKYGFSLPPNPKTKGVKENKNDAKQVEFGLSKKKAAKSASGISGSKVVNDADVTDDGVKVAGEEVKTENPLGDGPEMDMVEDIVGTKAAVTQDRSIDKSERVKAPGAPPARPTATASKDPAAERSKLKSTVPFTEDTSTQGRTSNEVNLLKSWILFVNEDLEPDAEIAEMRRKLWPWALKVKGWENPPQEDPPDTESSSDGDDDESDSEPPTKKLKPTPEDDDSNDSDHGDGSQDGEEEPAKRVRFAFPKTPGSGSRGNRSKSEPARKSKRQQKEAPQFIGDIDAIEKIARKAGKPSKNEAVTTKTTNSKEAGTNLSELHKTDETTGTGEYGEEREEKGDLVR
ncbi:hypothetical protein K491DRAFT_673893 [Lophiostoma macrostomum CBS 122681]|uniref:Uncharacterized protein n=1 Tax=Lophiostoma macrostomum CBS 122681 TaxID=1314788 RepID=A0A6A6TRM9_9PLEO|nr:hypothetical protein K491DRAFT_673893 [Lophiostoma macrostomum CBS 122681]